MMKDRGIIKKSLREMVEIEGYSISDKSKEHFALDSLIPPDSLFFFQYTFSYLFPLPNVQKNTQANIDLYWKPIYNKIVW